MIARRWYNIRAMENGEKKPQTKILDWVLIGVMVFWASLWGYNSIFRHPADEYDKKLLVDVSFQKGQLRRIEMPSCMVILSVTNAPMAQYNGPIGSGVLVKKMIGGKQHTILMTARHVAYAGSAISKTFQIHVLTATGIEHLKLKEEAWLVDGEKDDDLALLDVSYLNIADRAIDLDNGGEVKVLKGKDFAAKGVRRGTKAFALCGEPAKMDFVTKAGLYSGVDHGYNVITFESVPGNSGSPVFALVGDTVYFMGLTSLGGMVGKLKIACVVPLDNLYRLIDLETESYFAAEVKKGNPSKNRTTAVDLMKLKGIPNAYSGPVHNTWLLPDRLTVSGLTYTIRREEAQSGYFDVIHPDGSVVVSGRYITTPTPNDALRDAFSYACTNRDLSLEELDRRVSCEWTDVSRTMLHLVGVTKRHYFAYENMVVIFHRIHSRGKDVMVPLVKAMLVNTK